MNAPERLTGEAWKKRKQEVHERDYFMCRDIRPDGRICLQGPPKHQIQCAHIVARKKGGSDEMINLITKCVECHGREHPWMFKYAMKTAKNLVNIVKYRVAKRALNRSAVRIAKT
jgi:5-methylcytosine-specific restriction endonuclease McrA